jgi:hypothetical protein
VGTTGLVHLHDLLVSLEVDLHQVAVLVKTKGFKCPNNILSRNCLPLLLLTPVTSPAKIKSYSIIDMHTRW